MPDETTTKKEEHGATLLTWEFPEYEQHDRPFGWYVLAIPLALAMLIWALLTQNYLFAVIILLATALLVRQHRIKPVPLTFTLFEDGIDIHGRHFYSYRDLRSFWIVYEPPEVKKLYFSFNTALRPNLSIPLEAMNPITIRETLSRFLREDLEREGEPTIEALARLLKL